MILQEIRRCYAQISLMFLALLLIPWGGRFLPKVAVETEGGEKRVVGIFVLMLGFITLLTVYGLASRLFHAERKKGALEYMLTLPQGKWRLLGQKIGARLLIVLPFWIVFMILCRFYLHDPILDPFLFSLNHPLYMQFSLLFMLGGGFLLSHHEQRNWGAVVSLLLFYDLVVGTLFLSSLFSRYGWFSTLPLHRRGVAYALSVIICLLLLLLPFLTMMKRFDLRSFVRDRVLKRGAVPLLAGFLALSVAGLIWL